MKILPLIIIAFCFFSCGTDSGGGNSGNTSKENTSTNKPKTFKPDQAVIDAYIKDLEAMTTASKNIEQQIKTSRENSDGEDAEYDLFVQQAKTDSMNMIRLSKMLNDNGWIARSVYGNKASDEALAILNKASDDHHVYYLTMLSNSFSNGEVRPSGFAEIYDKAMIAQGKKQLYGTQLSFNESEGTNTIHPIEDEPNIEKRRKMVGLEPMTAYWQKFGIVYPKGTTSPNH